MCAKSLEKPAAEYGAKCQVEYGTDYPGCNLIGQTKEGSWQECAKACSQTPGCHYWSWEHKLSPYVPTNCYKKTAKCRTRADYRVISGNEACVSEYQCVPNFGHDLKCSEENTITKTVEQIGSWEQCAETCHQNVNGCKHWTYQHSGSTIKPGSCFLTSSTECQLVPNPNFISGNQDCQITKCDKRATWPKVASMWECPGSSQKILDDTEEGWEFCTEENHCNELNT